tara:strand:- start:137 stop:316 length:180 start_codon:yes stop_codon:yes gene_type:complete
MTATATKLAKLMGMSAAFNLPVGWVGRVVDAWVEGEGAEDTDPRAYVENQMRRASHGSR